MKLFEAATAGAVEAVGGGIAGAVGGSKSGLRFPGQRVRGACRCCWSQGRVPGTSMHQTHSKAKDEEGEKIGGLF